MNDYDSLARNYSGSNVKPDKLYSILPTVLGLVENCLGKTAIDIGCGAGFFTLPLAKLGASAVCGVDNSQAQITLASRVSSHRAIKYIVGDVFTQHGGPADIITVPFVLNYARTIPILRHFLGLIYTSLNKEGKVVFVVDLPNGRRLERFGATKTLLGSCADETQLQIDLFDGTRKICTLNAVYYLPTTIVTLLTAIGFKNIQWHTPIVSEEGVRIMGANFWKDYLGDTELGYLTAEK